MQWMQGTPFYLLIAFALSFYLGAASFKYRHLSGRRFFWILSILVSILILTTIFEIMSASFTVKLWWRNIQQIPLFLIALFIYALAMDYADKYTDRVRRRIWWMSVPAAVYWLLIFTDQFHHLMRSRVGLERVGALSEIYVHPTLLNMMFLACSQILCLYAVFRLAIQLRNTPKYYFRQHLLLLIGVSVPIVLIFLLPALHVKILGYMALSFLPGGLIIYYALFRYQLLAVWPIAKDKIFANMKDGIILADPEDAMVELNPAAERMLAVIGRSEKGTSIGGNVTDYIRNQPELLAAYQQRTEGRVEISADAGQEHTYDVSLNPIAMNASGHPAMLLVLSDISEKKRHDRELFYLASVDELTGLYNRRYFIRRVDDLLTGPAAAVSLYLIDIDDFKTINDTYGHLTGDDALSQFSALLKESYADKGIAGRLGGEEFAVFLTGIDEAESIVEAERLRARIAERRFRAKDASLLSITASIGVALAERQNITFEELYHLADQALYTSKHTGKNKVISMQRQVSS